MQSRADKPQTRRPLAVVFVVVLLVSLCAAGIPASADSLPGGIPPGAGGLLAPGIPAVDSGAAGEPALQAGEGDPVIVSVVAGEYHTCALTDAGGVKCWGYNGSGQLGNSTFNSSLIPVDVVGLQSGVVQIAAGGDHTCALMDDHRVMCWGNNYHGQVGDGTDTTRRSPVYVSGLNDAAFLAVGTQHSCAATTGGTVKCWGYNNYRQLMDGSLTDRWTPVNVIGLNGGVVSLAAGVAHTCALTGGGGMQCWGYNNYGELGDGTYGLPLLPVTPIGMDSGVAFITAFHYNTCAVTAAGGAKCWGWNSDGQLGNGSYWGGTEPGDVFELTSGVASIESGHFHTCAITSGGGVKCWGDDFGGELGDGDVDLGMFPESTVPVDVVGLSSGVVQLAAGYSHTCAVTSTGGVKCWGRNYFGEVGDNTTTQRNSPVDVYGLGMKKWTVLVFGNGDNELEEAVFKDLREMAFVGSNEEVSIVAQFDRNATVDLPLETTNTRRYYITRDETFESFSGIPIDDGASEANMGDPASLIDFVQWGKEHYPAERYILILWGHGSGFTIGPDSSSNNDKLDIVELKQAMAVITNGGANPIDILLLNACVMGNIETGSQLLSGMNSGDLPYVKYLLASEELMYEYWTLPYDYIMTFLEDNARASSEEIVRFIVDVSDQGGDIFGFYKNDTFSASKIGPEYQTLINAVKDFTSILSNHLGEYPDQIRNARADVQDFGDDVVIIIPVDYVDFVDLYHYAQLIHDTIDNEEIRTAALRVIAAIGSPSISGDVIVDEKHQSDYQNAHGISVWFPDTIEEYNKIGGYGGEPGFLLFTETTHWDNWIEKNLALNETNAVIVTIRDLSDHPLPNLPVTAYSGESSVGEPIYADEFGQATFTLDEGNYRFKVVKEGQAYWSDVSDHCAMPGCKFVEITTTDQVFVTVKNSPGVVQPGLTVRVYKDNNFTDQSAVTNAEGYVSFFLDAGAYRFQTTKNGSSYWSSPTNNCIIPGCTRATITITSVSVTARNSSGVPLSGSSVQAFKGGLAMGLPVTTNSQGKATLWVPPGVYEYQITTSGLAYWTAPSASCEIPYCTSVDVATIPPVVVTVRDTGGQVQPGVRLWAMNGDVDSGVQADTDYQGRASLTLPQGAYYFRAEQNGEQYWSDAENHCEVPGCENVDFSLTPGVPVTVAVANGANPDVLAMVYAFNGDVYTGLYDETDAAGIAKLLLPDGDYRFRVDARGQQFWSGAANHCAVPECTSVSVETPDQVVVTVRDENGRPKPGLPVASFSGGADSGFGGVTDSNGRVTLVPNPGSYRFRTELAGEYYWSGEIDNCAVPGCVEAEITVPVLLIPVAVTSHNGVYPDVDVRIYVFDDGGYTGYYGDTNDDGEAILLLPSGEYRFRVDKLEREFWSGASNHCAVPDCASVDVSTQDPVTVTVINDSTGDPEAGWSVQAYDGEAVVGSPVTTDDQGQAEVWLAAGNYRFRAEKDGVSFWSAAGNHCEVPMCDGVEMDIPSPSVVITSHNGAYPDADVNITVFDSDSDTGYSGITDNAGEAAIQLPPGEYRFRVEKGGRQFWSGPANHCSVPDCTSVDISTEDPVAVTVVNDATGISEGGWSVQAYAGDTAVGSLVATDDQGRAAIWLAAGNYRFRAEKDGFFFWSSADNHCAVPLCVDVGMVIPLTPVVVTSHVGAVPDVAVVVHAFRGDEDTGFSGETNDQGRASILLPPGPYRFTVEKQGRQFWSGAENHCVVPDCTSVDISTEDPVAVTVVNDATGNPEAGWSVQAYDADTAVGSPVATDDQGQAVVWLAAGNYRFQAEKDGTVYWSSAVNRCEVPNCLSLEMVYPLTPVTVTFLSGSAPEALAQVYAFSGGEYTGLYGVTDLEGRATIILPPGQYRFRADKNGVEYWSGTTDHCSTPACVSANIQTVTGPMQVVVTLKNADNTPEVGLNVYAFNNTTYAGYTAKTNAAGEVTLTLPQGNYRFRADKNGTQFWSGTANHCEVPGCVTAGVTTTTPVVITVKNADNTLEVGLNVYAFNGTTYAGYTAKTNAAGEVTLTLPQGNYRFRADKNGTQFWSGTANHCEVPGCVTAGVTTTTPVVITVKNADNTLEVGLNVYAFNGTTYAGYTAKTNAAGEVTLTLPQGSYRFRADKNGTQFWSGTANHCEVPGCVTAAVTTTTPVVVTVKNADSTPEAGLNVYAFNGTTYAGYTAKTNAAGEVTLTLPQGSYRFRADKNGTQFWSGTANHCEVPGCVTAAVTTTTPVVVTVKNADSTPEAGLNVYAFNNSTYAGYTAKTNAAGEVTLTLPKGNYRFRADKNGTQFWSGTANHCEVPGCVTAGVTTTTPVVITVKNADNTLEAGLNVYAFNNTTYAGYTAKTNAAGEVTLTLPQGNYRFRADKNGTQFWSGTANHCEVPGCVTAGVTTTTPVVITVKNADNTLEAGLNVYAFNNTTYAGYTAKTNAAGEVTLTLPQGSYRFRADKNGTQFWSGTANHCEVPGCVTAGVTTTTPVVITVKNADNTLEAGLNVYAFNNTTYAGYTAKTNAAGEVTLTLPQGSYRFRADKNGTQFWSGTANHCEVPGCVMVSITTPAPASTPTPVSLRLVPGSSFLEVISPLFLPRIRVMAI